MKLMNPSFPHASVSSECKGNIGKHGHSPTHLTPCFLVWIMRAGIDVIINAHQIEARESPMLIKVRNFLSKGRQGILCYFVFLIFNNPQRL